jgi:hypothetical protein
MKKTATIILNRNLPEVTDRLYDKFYENDGDETDIFVVESGSEKEKLSKHCSWWANWEESLEHGLRFPRGFNYALSELLKEKKYYNYEYFFFVCNDAKFEDDHVIKKLREEIEKHPRVGVISPCSRTWGEKEIIGENNTKYFWYVEFLACLVRRDFIEVIREFDEPNYMNFLFDGRNFRGFEADIELVAKGYANDWATAITTKTFMSEDENLLKTKADLIKTDNFDDNLIKVISEGKKWMRRKYGFNSRWTFNLYSKFFYENFFEYYPDVIKYKI